MSYTLITGASSGIGEEFARQYAKRKHPLILVARSKDKLERLASELSSQHQIPVHTIPLDLSQVNSAEELYNNCEQLGFKVKLLINNAGVGLIEKFEDHDIHRIEEMILLNVLTLTKLCYLFLNDLKENRGAILNVASQAAFEPIPYMAAYGGTKAFVLNFTEALRVELEDYNVKVMALCPGPTYTKFFKRANSNTSEINFKFRNPYEVVSTAILSLENEKAIAMPGWENRMWTFFTHLMPRSLLAKLSQNMVSKKNKNN